MCESLNSESFKLTFTRAELALLACALTISDKEGWPLCYPGMEWDNDLYKKVAQQVRQPWLASMYWLACGVIPGSYVASEERDFVATRHRLANVSKRWSFAGMVKTQINIHLRYIECDDYPTEFMYWNAVY